MRKVKLSLKLYAAESICCPPFIVRPLLSKYTKSDNTVTNSNAIIGKTALVTEEISLLNSTGQISVDGEIWSAKTMDPNLTIPKGSKVEIIGIDGVKACVASNYQMPSN